MQAPIPPHESRCRGWFLPARTFAANGPNDGRHAWIAATAILYDSPLVTHNRGDYLGVSGQLVPWPRGLALLRKITPLRSWLRSERHASARGFWVAPNLAVGELRLGPPFPLPRKTKTTGREACRTTLSPQLAFRYLAGESANHALCIVAERHVGGQIRPCGAALRRVDAAGSRLLQSRYGLRLDALV